MLTVLASLNNLSHVINLHLIWLHGEEDINIIDSNLHLVLNRVLLVVDVPQVPVVVILVALVTLFIVRSVSRATRRLPVL